MEAIKSQFILKEGITHLNHGSFGACPKSVFEDYQQWQVELEKDPMHFIAYRGAELHQHSREVFADFINCKADELVYTTNPSYAINIIAKSLRLEKGDEILTTDIEYGAMDRTWNYYCDKSGANYIRQHISLPILSKEQIVDEFFAGLTENTKAIFISQITSATALRLPVEEICKRAKSMGLLTIVDGAHVPGQLELDIAQLDADIYTGACHKWILTPKGCSFLYVKKEIQHLFDPLIVSWGYKSDHPSESQFIDYHEYQGTRDFSAFLTVPKALEFRKENNWEQVSETCKLLIRNNYQSITDALGTSPICPIDKQFLVQMCSAPVCTDSPLELQHLLYNEYKIHTPVMTQGNTHYLRTSINGYNTQDDIDKLLKCNYRYNKDYKLDSCIILPQNWTY